MATLNQSAQLSHYSQPTSILSDSRKNDAFLLSLNQLKLTTNNINLNKQSDGRCEPHSQNAQQCTLAHALPHRCYCRTLRISFYGPLPTRASANWMSPLLAFRTTLAPAKSCQDVGALLAHFRVSLLGVDKRTRLWTAAGRNGDGRDDAHFFCMQLLLTVPQLLSLTHTHYHNHTHHAGIFLCVCAASCS